MNKLFKYILIGITTCSVLFACTKADLVLSSSDTVSIGHDSYNYVFDNYDMFCIKAKNCQDRKVWFFPDSIAGGGGYTNFNTTQGQALGVCAIKTNFLVINDGSTCDIIIDKYMFEDYTSQQCQTEYNLIPIENVTANYCRINFDLIDPAECPINSGTGTIIWSNLNINDTPYAQNQNINVYIPDFLAWTISFNDYTTAIEVEGYNADTEYIEDVIAKENLTPTNEDFKNMLTGLVNFFPYLAIAILFYFLIKVVYKIFK